ncbi:Activating signal cointegrator 1 complex subunit 3 [Liparis tanakae]|uniref:Activating signal cointegrator 1 complex subunit 3 n=1 Tax=Liparis tanakae TaxID=230148 RepID=A0A4Z2HYY1_9TELE|nr:Activating signal cointegrator 1 complex subunit 3 [Liparis tanakae]
MSPPRLTGALRSFSNVCKREDVTEQLYDLKTKRLKRRELFAREGLTWKKIFHFCSEHQDKVKQQSASQELKNLLLAAKEIVGIEHGQVAIESAAVFLFETFHNSDHVGTEETRAIKQMFGPFPASAAEASCACVARLVAQLGDSRVENFIQTLCSRPNPQRGSAFGRNIAFSHDCYALDPLEDLPCSGTQEDSTSLDFLNFLNNQQSERRAGEEEGSSSGRALSSRDDEAVLRTEVEKYLDGGNMISSSPEELCTSLFEMLASHKSDDELQNESASRGLDVLIATLCVTSSSEEADEKVSDKSNGICVESHVGIGFPGLDVPEQMVLPQMYWDFWTMSSGRDRDGGFTPPLEHNLGSPLRV